MNKNDAVKSGKEIVDTFFKNIKEIKDVDTKITSALLELYNEGKFTKSNVINKIRKIREDNDN